MRLAILTNSSIRHKYLANELYKSILSFDPGSSVVVTSELAPDSNKPRVELSPLIEDHFKLRYATEAEMFDYNDFFLAPVLPLPYRELNSEYVCEVLEKFNPEVVVVFGSSIIKKPLLSLLPAGKTFNLHLGLSPYYRGSGTNFWPFVNKELEYVGSTIIYLDAGVDTGDILCHVTPEIEIGDNVHTVGCKVIKSSVNTLKEIIKTTMLGKTLPRTKQWTPTSPRYYKSKDFNELALKQYYRNLKEGLITNYLKNNPKPKKIINFDLNL
ncbi:MAG: hypothetical protein COV29_02165 [Candidatus Yanofskybacteria bacterium CG10_big_fil_rev_8_21_14_0_10_36_16]|uniref:Formyl transferase N-terminal domain-containing protein n=1 Tax=Candidatus Yanofskybacteria bacterium CG10_big_fil_rev_8_21_14_0_10_36_16 TaxID=1975096 RepID=A0A2J0Q7I9_9BACT|nr:MAG: hypothetical protein COV29_02165 [Candidatus Yanofskybacteria bacterium CG10_big_fil_rev_8_21_14_0_10_36_16]